MRPSRTRAFPRLVPSLSTAALVPVTIATLLAHSPTTAFATAKTFIGGDGSLWSTITVWNPSGVPLNAEIELKVERSEDQARNTRMAGDL